jgi:NAD-dependent dihydropyrimidine dehydrogenase PreA subunit
LKKRHLLGAAGVGVAGLAMLRVTPQARGSSPHPKLIRPPGSRAELEFLERCIGCGACMKVCPTGGLQPAMTEAGLEGLWTPVLVPKIGYCEYECNACGQVCPTAAIEPLFLEKKKQVRLGMATFDTSRCIPYALNEPCAVCEEHCPVPDKAIKMRLPGRGHGAGSHGAGGHGGGQGHGRGGGRGRRRHEADQAQASAGSPYATDADVGVVENPYATDADQAASNGADTKAATSPYATEADRGANPYATDADESSNPYATEAAEASPGAGGGGAYGAGSDAYAATGGEVLLPYVDYDKCTGCGICEHVCPYKAVPAIRVTSDNESRHPDRVPFL